MMKNLVKPENNYFFENINTFLVGG